jgi:hypothetical protein
MYVRRSASVLDIGIAAISRYVVHNMYIEMYNITVIQLLLRGMQ